VDEERRPVVQVYPAASLRSWGLYRPGYKQAAKPDVLGCLVDDLRARAQWLDCGRHEQVIRRSHDAFDAVIAAMTGRAAAQDQTFPPGRGDLAAALAEGWIAIPNSPNGGLSRFGGARNPRPHPSSRHYGINSDTIMTWR
jgi:hypothetical protein